MIFEPSGVFQIISGPANGAVLAVGNSAPVTIEFVGSDPVDDNDAVSFEAVLTITSNDFDEGNTTIALSGLAQFQSEGVELDDQKMDEDQPSLPPETSELSSRRPRLGVLGDTKLISM